MIKAALERSRNKYTTMMQYNIIIRAGFDPGTADNRAIEKI